MQGTRPQKKSRNLSDVKRYLQIATVNERGTLIVKKSSAFMQLNLIVVPHNILVGLITALHIQFDHPTASQLTQIFDRYFYAICSSDAIKEMTNSCDVCNSLKKIPAEFKEQSSSSFPTTPGQNFSCDIIRRCKQKIFVTRDIFSSFTTATFVEDESAKSLREAILTTTSLLRQTECTVRVDGATGFVSLRNDSQLAKYGIVLDIGRVKNPNKNPVVDKAIQELEREFLTADFDNKELNMANLEACLRRLNSKIRHNGMSAKEIILRRDQMTGKQLEFQDNDLVDSLHALREKNHVYSAKSKARGGSHAEIDGIGIGDLVFIKNEGDKFSDVRCIWFQGSRMDFVFCKRWLMANFFLSNYKSQFPSCSRLLENASLM